MRPITPTNSTRTRTIRTAKIPRPIGGSKRPTSRRQPRKKPSSTTCMRDSSVGLRTGLMQMASSRLSAIRLYIDSRTYEGFRKLIADEFNEIWIIDLKGNARTSGERRRREGGNVFNDQIRVGIAIYFCVKKKGAHGCHIRYQPMRDYAKSDEKRDFLHTPLNVRKFEDVKPDTDNNWINLTDNDFDNFIPIVDKKTKLSKAASHEQAMFKLFTLGIVTNRDEWAYDEDPKLLQKKIRLFCE